MIAADARNGFGRDQIAMHSEELFPYRLRLEARRAQGWFNDFDEDAMIDMLTAAGWKISTRQPAAESDIFVCHRDTRIPA